MTPDNYYSIFLKLKGKRVTVIGGGEVALRKVKDLLDAGALVRLISPFLMSEIEELERIGEIEVIRRGYRRGDISGSFLVIAATSSRAVNMEISRECEEMGILVNVVDDPELCNFIVPSTVRRGDLTIAISTKGASPALARVLRESLEGMIDDRFDLLTRIMARKRNAIRRLSEEQKGVLLSNLRRVVANLIETGKGTTTPVSLNEEKEIEKEVFSSIKLPLDIEEVEH